MAKASDQDKDLSLKLRFKRLMFLMGYYSPIEVELSQFHEQLGGGGVKRSSLTDLDVLGIKYDLIFAPHRVVADCKTGKNVSDANRLFWVRGVSDYFNANVAYFLRPQVNLHAKAVAPKLGVRVLDEPELAELEKIQHVDELVLPLTDPALHAAREAIWGVKVPRGAQPTPDQLALKDVYAYLSYTYWYTDQHRNLLMLVSQFTRVAHLLDPSHAGDVLLAHVGLERFAHCMLEMVSQIYGRGLLDAQVSARQYLFGGPIGLREREQLIREVSKLTRTPLELNPSYLPDVLELAGRILHNPAPASRVLPYLDAIYMWCIQLGHSDLARVFSDLDTGTIVLARDLAITFCRAAGLSEQLLSALLSL